MAVIETEACDLGGQPLDFLIHSRQPSPFQSSAQLSCLSDMPYFRVRDNTGQWEAQRIGNLFKVHLELNSPLYVEP